MSGRKFIKEVKTLEVCVQKKHFCVYEIMIDFNTGDCEVEIVDVENIIDRVNAWDAAVILCGETARYHTMLLPEKTSPFPWPQDERWATPEWDCPAKVIGFNVYYYDVYGEKHHTELIRY